MKNKEHKTKTKLSFCFQFRNFLCLEQHAFTVANRVKKNERKKEKISKRKRNKKVISRDIFEVI